MAMAGGIPPTVMFRHPHYPSVFSPHPPPCNDCTLRAPPSIVSSVSSSMEDWEEGFVFLMLITHLIGKALDLTLVIWHSRAYKA